jgi:hypothetical protein
MPHIQIDALSARAKALATGRWSWLNHIAAAWLMAMLALYHGILSFAAIREMSIECRDEPTYITTVNGDRLTLEDGKTYLVTEQKHRECRVALGETFVILFP